jgi:hypothetical protein
MIESSEITPCGLDSMRDCPADCSLRPLMESYVLQQSINHDFAPGEFVNLLRTGTRRKSLILEKPNQGYLEDMI